MKMRFLKYVVELAPRFTSGQHVMADGIASRPAIPPIPKNPLVLDEQAI